MNTKRSPERAADDENEDLTANHNDDGGAQGEEKVAKGKEAAEDEGADQDAEAPEADEDATAAKIEARARAMGWVPEDEWRGQPPKRGFMTPQEFLARAYANTPVMEERLDRMASEVEGTKNKLEETTRRLAETSEVLQEMNERAKKTFQKGYQQARADIEAERDRAIEEADKEGVRAADKRLSELDEEHEGSPKAAGKAAPAARQEQEQPRIAPDLVEWKKGNSWFDEDDELQAIAITIDGRLAQKEPGMALGERLAKVSAEIRRRYPEKFRNARRDAPSAVNGAGNRGNSSQRAGKTYADLPSEAKAACDRFVRTIPGFTKADYLRDYEWGA